jgi:hypothetical protein
MPPANQQGSKAGLVTALVIFVILFVVSAVFAIYFGVQWSNEQLVHKADVAKVSKFATPAMLADSTLTGLASRNGETVIDALENQRDDMTKLITGSATDPDAATKATDSAIAAAQTEVTALKLPAVVPQSNLVQAVTVLTQQLATLSDQATKAQQAQADAEAAATKAKADADTDAKDAQAKVDDANKQLQEVKDQAAQQQKDQSNNIAGIQKSAQDTLKTYQDAIQKLQVAQSQRDQTIAANTKLIGSLERRLARMRIDPKESVVQQSDGKVVRVADSNTVFIDIGHQQGVTPGLTFEVYDPNKGIPALGDGQREDDLPVGLASLEVTHVLTDSSECRVVRTSPGETIVPGDVIMNLVFDPHTKYKFVVYGDFDLNQTGTPTPSDAEVIKRLVTQWGGQVQPASQLDTDTDFLVLGTEPVVPDLSEDDKSNAQAVKRHDDAQAALDAYDALRQKAIEFGIPILNQNRFLYYTGYYDLAAQ